MSDDQDDDDIVVRLKDHGLFNQQQRNRLFMEAADEIERLREDLESARAQVTIAKQSNGFQLLADAEIERLRDMCINREEFIAQHGLWKEFSQYLSEPTSTAK